MKPLLLGVLLLHLSGSASAQRRFSTHELSLNGFRNPSIGVEYRYRRVSVHAGYYPTRLQANVTTSFLRAGATYWFFPVGKKENPSSFYASASYLRGFNQEYNGENALLSEVGFRWVVWRGLNLRLGAAVLSSASHAPRLNPTPGISWSFFSHR